MGWLKDIMGGGPVTEPIKAVGNVVTSIWGTKGEKLTHEQVMAKLAAAPHLANMELNKVEAGHRSIFVAGWRPFIGWVCGLGLANAFLVTPFLEAYTSATAMDIPTDIMLELVLGMLGLGALRTAEKLKGRTK